jgi:hypothetical protein
MSEPLDNLLARLDGVREVNGQFEARCPAHDDRNPSLSVGVGDDGRLLVHCQRGCALGDVLRPIGLTIKDLFPSANGHAANGHASKPLIVASYGYHDEQGALLYQVCRFDPKGFRQRRPKDGGGWDWKLGDVRRVPYRLPELLAAPADAMVFIPEGEKDVDNLVKLGLVATCNAGGAGKWRKEYADYFRGRRVAILPDDDEPGRKHAEQVAATLNGIAAEVRIIELPGRIRSPANEFIGLGKDVSDWLAAGGTADELKRIVEAGPIYGKGSQIVDIPKTCDEPRHVESVVFERLSSAELAAYSEDVAYIVEDVWPEQQGGVISGRFKVLKTNVAIDLGMSASLAVPFLGRFYVPFAIRVGIMSAESGAKTLRERGEAIAASKGIALADCGNLVWSTSSPRLARFDHLDALKRFIVDDALEGLIVDPTYLALCDIGSDSSNVFKMGAVLGPLTEMIQQTGCSIILVNHNIKGRAKDIARFDAPDLAEVSMSGFMEWARFWLLLGPRQEWSEDDGKHWLWLRTGGSAGHAGLWHLDVTEGKRSDPDGRRWETSVVGATEGQRNVEQAKAAAKADAKRKAAEEWKTKVVKAAGEFPHGETEKQLRARSRLRTNQFNEAFDDLAADGTLVQVELRKSNGQTYVGWKLKPDDD